MDILLETPVFTLEAALKAAKLGVDRLELCSSFPEGGETPGVGILSYLKEKTDVPVFVMVRPRGGDFVYSPGELEVMQKEIELLGKYGADGFVFGVLKPNGEVNTKACQPLLNAAGKKPCTFHRAFDVCRNREKALEKIIDCGFRRILTSGGKKSVAEGLDTIIRLMELAKNRIIIMPGGGMKPELVKPLKETGFLREVHASCKIRRKSKSEPAETTVSLQAGGLSEDRVLTINSALVEGFRNVL